jgi:hypothetical protein
MKEIHPWLRASLYAAGVFLLVTGLLLYALTEFTDAYFAWTIQSRLTASTLGAFYGTMAILGYLSAREPVWVRARGVMPAMITFTAVTLATTLLHLNKFHLVGGNLIARGVAWVWLLFYLVAPPLMLGLLILQNRQPGGDAPRTSILSDWFRLLLLLQTLVAFAAAIGLFITPQAVLLNWPWDLNQVAARALSAWLFAIFAISFQAVFENDWNRIKVAMLGYVAFGLLDLVAVARYSNEMDWQTTGGQGYVMFVLSLLTVGVIGWFRASRASQPSGQKDKLSQISNKT